MAKDRAEAMAMTINHCVLIQPLLTPMAATMSPNSL